MEREDIETLIFKLDVLYKSYDYITYGEKLKFFPATLKNSALCWFMKLGGGIIGTWEKMK